MNYNILIFLISIFPNVIIFDERTGYRNEAARGQRNDGSSSCRVDLKEEQNFVIQIMILDLIDHHRQVCNLVLVDLIEVWLKSHFVPQSLEV